MKKFNPTETVCRDLWAYPVIDLTRPRVRTCCKRGGTLLNEHEINQYNTDVFLNLPGTIDDRALMLDGIRPDNCKVCWDLEDAGSKSFRQDYLDFQYHFNNINGVPPHFTEFRSFEQLVEVKETILHSNKPNKLDLSLGTYCDQKCVYCNSDYSSQWEAEDKKYGLIDGDPAAPLPVNYPSINSQSLAGWTELFFTWFDTVYEHLERIALLGGEPTISPMFIPLSKHIVNSLKIKSHSNCTFSIVTNLNWKKNILDHVYWIRRELPPTVTLVLEVSMESVGIRAEYIRHGINWDRFLYNLKSVASLDNVEIKLIITLNALCITSIKEYFELIKIIELDNDKSFKIIVNRVVFPKWLSTDILDSNFKPFVYDFIQWLEIYNDGSKDEILVAMREVLIELDTPRDQNLIGYFLKCIDAIDKRRGINFRNIFPEFDYLFNTYNQYSTQMFSTLCTKKWYL